MQLRLRQAPAAGLGSRPWRPRVLGAALFHDRLAAQPGSRWQRLLHTPLPWVPDFGVRPSHWVGSLETQLQGPLPECLSRWVLAKA